MNARHFWELVLGTIVGLLPVVNPLACAPTFLAITDGDSHERRLAQLRAGCFYMIGILVSFLIGGTFIMGFFGISIPGLRIAGGLLVAGIGSGLLLGPGREIDRHQVDHAEALAKRDIAFSPLGIPMLAGPGAIAVTIGFTSLAKEWIDYTAIIIGILVVAVIVYVVLRVADRVVRVVGVNSMQALSKVMGFLILCIGVQFIVNGVLDILTDPVVLHGIRQALQSK